MELNKHQQFMSLYKPLHEPFIRYCNTRAFGIMEAEDLAQEAILSALQRFEHIRHSDKLLHYLIATVRNIVNTQYRRKKFQAPWEDFRLQQIVDQAPSAEVAMDINMLLKAIEELPEKQREAILLFEISGFSIREISQLQDSSAAATKTRLSRARQRLRVKFKEQQPTKELSSTLHALMTVLF